MNYLYRIIIIMYIGIQFYSVATIAFQIVEFLLSETRDH